MIISLQIEKELPLIEGDPEKIRQILINLLNNAIKFTGISGQITLKASSWTQPTPTGLNPDSSYIKVAIQDNGIGIKQENLQKLFGEFVQLDTSASRKYGGTGLGLSITRHLVEMHHGKIEVESSLGEGSTFSFFIPVAKPREQKEGIS